jgi:aryl-alcohol dehydrogenase-like predicted oxidoreductase
MIFGCTVEKDDSISLIHKAMDDGVSFVATAKRYNNGLTEEAVGMAFVVIAFGRCNKTDPIIHGFMD